MSTGKPIGSRASPPPFHCGTLVNPENVAFKPMDAADEVTRRVPISVASMPCLQPTHCTAPAKRNSLGLNDVQESTASVDSSATVDNTDGAVCYGQIANRTTMLWRSKVKAFSDDRSKYPSWNDDICDQVKALLEQDGVTRYLARQSQVGSQDKKETKMKCPTKWRVATSEEILEKTFQRFKDDRKTPKTASVMTTTTPGVKRKRGRPPKKVPRTEQNVTPEKTTDRLPWPSPSPTNVLISLEEDLGKCRSRIGQELTFEYTMSKVESSRLPELRRRLSMESSRLSCEEKTRLLQLTYDHECVQTFLCRQIEDALSNVPAVITSYNETEEAVEDESLSEILDQMLNEPWYPIKPEDVCFEWNKHHGTGRWQDVIKEISLNFQDYPEWNESICDCVRDKLAAENISYFCSFLDSQRQPCKSITEGMWYPATNEEIVEKTKQQFLQNRQILEDPSKCTIQSLGTPPTGGFNGSGPQPDNPNDNNHSWSDSDDHEMGGSSDNFFDLPAFGFHCARLPVEAVYQSAVKLYPPHTTRSTEQEQEQQSGLTELRCHKNTLEMNPAWETREIVAGALLPSEESDDVLDKTEKELPNSFVLEPHLVEDDTSCLCSALDKISIEVTQNPLIIVDAEVLESSESITGPSNISKQFVLGPPILTAECSVIPAHRQRIVCGMMFANQTVFDGQELADVATIGPRNNDEKQTMMIPPPMEEATPGAVRVPGISGLLQDDLDDEEHVDEHNPSYEFCISNTFVAKSAALDKTPTIDSCSAFPQRLKSLCDIMSDGEAFSIISERLANDKWRRVLTTLDAQEFGCLISHIRMDFDRSRVAELLASRILDEHGAHGFTCQHAAMAIQHTPFRATMAERILPYCVDISSNLPLVKKELEDWDMSLLLISLCRKVQSVHI